jgi:hypothetical protein
MANREKEMKSMVEVLRRSLAGETHGRGAWLVEKCMNAPAWRAYDGPVYMGLARSPESAARFFFTGELPENTPVIKDMIKIKRKK